MGFTPPAQLALLREVVGPGPGDEALSAAWQRAGGDLAAAVNIILDGPGPGPAASVAQVQKPCGVKTGPKEGAAILLDDSDNEEVVPVPPRASPLSSSSSADLSIQHQPQQTSGGSSSSSAGSAFTARLRAGSAGSAPRVVELAAAERPTKRLKQADNSVLKQSSPAALETPPKALPTPKGVAKACEVEWAMLLGSFDVNAYSTTRVGPDQKFQYADGSFGRLMSPGARLELKWAVEAKKAKGRPGSAAGSVGQEGGTVRFDVCGHEVGKFPAWVSKALVPLLSRRLIDVDAVLGCDPPRHLELGTTVPVVVKVSLRSSALSTPGRVTQSTGRSAANSSTTQKPKAPKGHKAVQKEEADREIQRTATAQLLEQLKLPCRRRAVEGSDAALTSGGSGDAQSNGSGKVAHSSAGGPACDDEAEDEEEDEMSRAAAAQLGRSHALERPDLPGVVLPSKGFSSRLRPYQAQAVYWMWQKENPTSSLPPRFLTSNPWTADLFEADPSSPPSGRAGASSARADETPAQAEKQLHPMWDEYELQGPTGPLPGRESASFLYHHRTTGALSLDFPDAALAHCRGGILADDMGLGKTVMCLALFSLDYGSTGIPSARTAAPELRALEDTTDAPAGTPAVAQSSKQLGSFFQQQTQQQSNSDDSVGGVLVVAPPSLIRQWRSEAEKHFPPGLCPAVFEYHGAGRTRTAEQLRAYGLVLTTYGTLSWEKEDGPLFQVYWRRIILDEAHAIKNRLSRQAQAAFRLRSFCRWCVTGTPLQNSVEELYSLVRFLRVDPWSAWPCWRKAVALPLERGRHGDGAAMTDALDTTRRIVQPLLLRRTKETRNPKTFEPLLTLPAKHVHVLELKLSDAERDFYDALYSKAKTQFDTFVAQGEALSKYTHILQLILKLRQALCHPFLVFARDKAPDEDMETMEKRCLQEMVGGDGLSEKFVGNLLEDLRNGQLPDCPICCDVPEDPTMTPCGHIFCRECSFKIVKQCMGECPVCRRGGVDRKSLRVLPGASRFPSRLLAKASAAGSVDEDGDAGQQDPVQANSGHSTKMKELLALLRKDCVDGNRAVVFSQWTSFLDLVGSALDAAGIHFKRFDGSLSLNERADRVAWLSEAEVGGAKGRVLLVSLKAGGTGLNLVAANRLYMLDMWWNPAVEEQAIQRVHRIGQKREVHVYKFVMEDTIDMGILQLQKAKERLLDDALRGGSTQEAATKLTMEDLKRLFNPCRSSLRAMKGGSSSSTSVPVPVAAQVASSSSIPQVHDDTDAEMQCRDQEMPELEVLDVVEAPAETASVQTEATASTPALSVLGNGNMASTLTAKLAHYTAPVPQAVPRNAVALAGATSAAPEARSIATEAAAQQIESQRSPTATAPAAAIEHSAPAATVTPTAEASASAAIAATAAPAEDAPVAPFASRPANEFSATVAPPTEAAKVAEAAAIEAFAQPAWEAGGADFMEDSDAAIKGNAAPVQGHGGFDSFFEDDDELSDSDLLAACEAVEARDSAQAAVTGNEVAMECEEDAPGGTVEADDSPAAAAAAACWAAMPLDEA
eukprot:TRINITY_DN49155_c0_g1_i1.p1 TRINITY_DN49155_c0_g1~~TRINITY_DN49155_c0_g1_i1.p1  ORF type:complete len:1543 (-),score=385.59 TRINITY_DN49155_c0_g1_i1:264-4892(-)